MMTSVTAVLHKGDAATHYVPVKEPSRVVGMKVIPAVKDSTSSAAVNVVAPSNSSATILTAAVKGISAGSVVEASYGSSGISSVAEATLYQVFDDSTPVPITFASCASSTVVTVQLTLDPFVIGPRTALDASSAGRI